MESPQDTIAAIATPLGEGGLGVIRLSGLKAIEIAGKLFHSPKIQDLNTVPSHTCHFGKLASPPALSLRERENTMPSPLPSGEGGRRPGEADFIDQVVLTLFRAPHSYTGEDVVEFSAHGSPFILKKILDACVRGGARLAGPGEFTQRAFLNGKMDLTQAEAVAELIRAKTDKTHTAAIAQLEGRLAQKVRALRDSLLPLLAHIEVGLDHSDEDHDFMDRADLVQRCGAVQSQVQEVLASAQVGKILREGLRIALVGRPNVGKSSLLNALLREERAIVTPIAGTTRDTLEESVNWDGMPVVLTDTAGLRQAGDTVEQIGIERTQKAVAAADLVIGLFDGSEPMAEEDRRVIESCLAKPHVWVINKVDLPIRLDPQALASLNGQAPVVPVSAKRGTGLDRLIEWVKNLALQQQAGSAQAEWLLNARHRQALESAAQALSRAVQAAQDDRFEECVAMELRSALGSLGEIIGETATEDLLGEIFRSFCVGK